MTTYLRMSITKNAPVETEIWLEQGDDPTVHYMPCPNHEAAIEVEGYCPCFDGLEIDWDKTTGESFE